MSEEARRASGNVPLAMVLGTFINGILAFGFVIAVLYSMGSLENAVESPTGTNALMSTGIIVRFYALFSILASMTRLIWAFARDNGLPFSRFFAKISPTHKIPLRALCLATTIVLLLSLINIASTTLSTRLYLSSPRNVSILYLTHYPSLLLQIHSASLQNCATI
ncbi:7914fd40-8f93-4d7b-b6e7-275fb973416d [Sclerotinia trifoliorum]|uniref:7914fd40-8f93-4d7b-b6e7-275fb973416d n=1 Tax=Sclerotinia trifoliorum TaxID=28548 RepID=A0A8H2ZTZ0_9HELO|nr:7914fd40-8f93-4d7b-b6e7-275fb973416d [Sclerotinia trifoliorum]